MAEVLRMNPCPNDRSRGSFWKRRQSGFLRLLPRIELHARVYFRHLKCPHRKAEAIAEVVALSWKWFLRLAEKGKDAGQFPTALASFAARAVKSGRRLCGQERAREAMSSQAQQRHHFMVGKLPDFSTLRENPLAEALAENTVSPVPDQVAFRVDFPRWRRSRSRDRRVIDALMAGGRTLDVARHFNISPGRVSQLRRVFAADWERFCDSQTVS
jgi:hypothetical protein